jgi:hypothetical protein
LEEDQQFQSISHSDRGGVICLLSYPHQVASSGRVLCAFSTRKPSIFCRIHSLLR